VHPDFIRIGPLDIHTYGVLVAVGFLAGIMLAAWRAKQEGFRPEQASDLGVWLIVAGMLGGKLFHLAFYWRDFIADWRVNGLSSLREGFVFHGGFIGACVATILYAQLNRLPLWKLADVFAPSVALGHAFGRLGCFFNGCCYGQPCRLPWAVKFPAGHILHGVPLHPTQLYEVAGNLAIFAALSTFYRRKRFDGQIWWLYVLAYGIVRFVIEFFRGDYRTYYFDTFTIAHVVAAVLIVTALAGLKLCRHTK
jgi:phosphatidylglycerol:prolipoprotein diacylglycerol transferase